MNRVRDHIGFAVSYISIMLLIALACSFVPIVNIIVWSVTVVLVLAYPFLHFELYRDCEARQQKWEDKKLIKAWAAEKSLKEAREFYAERA